MDAFHLYISELYCELVDLLQSALGFRSLDLGLFGNSLEILKVV
jgi:hypothetical protein